MTSLGLDDLAHEVMLSCEIGVAQSDSRAFELTLDRLGTNPAETPFVDDTPGKVAAAGALGIRGHVHVDTGETIAVIRSFVA